jgi:uncharacterized protein YkwD
MIRSVLAVPLVLSCLCAQTARMPPAPPSTEAERAVVREITKIRMFPREYAKYLRALGKDFEGNRWKPLRHVPIRTNEGRAAVEEAAEFLEQVRPINVNMAFSEELHAAAWDHMVDQGPTGQTGHVGTNGSTFDQRILRRAAQPGMIGEVIMYGDETPRMAVIQLVIDDGVPDRGHRKALFNPEFRVAGAAIGPHKGYGTMTVVELADEIPSKP